jgi:lysozyme
LTIEEDLLNYSFPDVSMYQDDNNTPQRIDFAMMREQTSAVIIRAGQNSWIDPDFKHNWKAAKEAGLHRGSYWFYDSLLDPKKQAELWVSALAGDLGELPLWCDFEDRYGGAFGGWKHWYDFIEHLKTLVPGKAIGIYTGYYYWLEHTVAKAIPKASLNYFKQYPLWVAAYNAVGPGVPTPWDDWLLWQFTDNGIGAPYGVESKNIDLNYFNGSEAEFYQFFGLSEPAPLPDVEQSFEVKALYGEKEVLYKEMK